jgi:putative spermidine/putrescine transport system permease protein
MMAPLVYTQISEQANWPLGGALAFMLMAATLLMTVGASALMRRRS